MPRLHEEFVHLARLALAAKTEDVELYVRRVSRKLRRDQPDLADELRSLSGGAPARRSSILRKSAAPPPVDLESRLQLMRVVAPDGIAPPILEPATARQLEQIVSERQQVDILLDAGLHPTRSALLTGPPGVGKTMSAGWLAAQLDLPLLVLDLAAVMSSLLGRTGNNLRQVLDYAKTTDCVLLLDELDAIAKRRDDISEVGELKRLVTVLLQEVDNWPKSGLLLGATNHSDLLDPAVWRRFDMVVAFGMPEGECVRQAISRFLGDLAPAWVPVMETCLAGLSYSDIERALLRVRRAAALGQVEDDAIDAVVRDRLTELPMRDRKAIALKLVGPIGLSQRRAQKLTGVCRDTIRRAGHGGKAQGGDHAV